MSLRKSFSELSAPSPAPRFQTLAAQRSNSVSWVTPRSSVIASNSVRPGDLRLLLGSPPCRCSHDLGRALEGGHLAHAGDEAAVPLDAELEVLVRVEAVRVDCELRHSATPQASVWPAICWIRMTTNSAGLSGANPTRMFTIPRSMSLWVVVSESHLTK